MELLFWLLFAVAVLLGTAWYLSYSAARLDRLHAKVEGGLSALDAQLVRRAEATLELVNSGGLDPASALLLAGPAAESLERYNERTGEDLLEGQHFAGREDVEGELTDALRLALTEEVVERVRDDGGPGSAALDRVAAAAMRVQLARRFHNEAVAQVRRVRGKSVVRLFRLAGHADLPRTVDFDDRLPTALRQP
jgi:hypothetical protein